MDALILRKVVKETVNVARDQNEITYGELSLKVGLSHHRPLRYYLEEVLRMCRQHQFPPLTVLVVAKNNRRPGQGFYSAFKEFTVYDYIEVDNEELHRFLQSAVWNVTDWSELLQAVGLHDDENSSQPELWGLPDSELRAQALDFVRSANIGKTTTTFRVRNPWVQEYARRCAKGSCQLCGQPAPFCDAKAQPFLEVHHIHWLSKGGLDSIFNVVALCPNCHRRMHILKDSEDVLKLRDIAKNH